MNGGDLKALIFVVKSALADKLLIWATLLSLIALVTWTTMRNPEPMRFVGAGLLFAVLLSVLYFSKKE